MRKLFLVGLILTPMLILTACVGGNEKKATDNDEKSPVVEKQAKDDTKEESEGTKVIEAPENLPEATIKIEGYGEIKAELYPHKAPNTVSNFIELANDDFYDGLTIHRVVKDFVLQGGCPKGDGTGDPGYSIKGEMRANGFDINDVKHEKGVLSMARSRSYDSAGSQFFVVTKEAPHLDNEYTGFGKVTEGMEIVDKINNVEVSSPGRYDTPVDKITIEDISIDLKGNKVKSTEKIK